MDRQQRIGGGRAIWSDGSIGSSVLNNEFFGIIFGSGAAEIAFTQSAGLTGLGSLNGAAEYTVTMSGTGGLVARGRGAASISFTGSVAMPVVVDIDGQGSFIISGQGDWVATWNGSGTASISVSGELKKRVRVRQVVVNKKYWL